MVVGVVTGADSESADLQRETIAGVGVGGVGHDHQGDNESRNSKAFDQA